MLVHHLKLNLDKTVLSLFKTCARPPHQYWQHCSDLDNKLLCEPHSKAMIWTDHISQIRQSTNHLLWLFSSPCISSMKLQPGLSSASLNFPCHTAPTPCVWLYILKTKLIPSGHDLDSCPCFLFWYHCPIIYPSPCSDLAVSFLPCGGMTFPPELDEHESLPLLQNPYLSHISVSIYLLAYKMVLF